jgi:hypothetical protein
MAQFLCGNDLRVLQFIAENPNIQNRQLTLTFATTCDIAHVVAGLRDRGLIRQRCCRRWSKHVYNITKDGKRQLTKSQNTIVTQHANTNNRTDDQQSRQRTLRVVG